MCPKRFVGQARIGAKVAELSTSHHGWKRGEALSWVFFAFCLGFSCFGVSGVLAKTGWFRIRVSRV